MYWAESVPAEIDIVGAIKIGIEQTCRHMLKIPIPMFGVKGIRFLSKKVRSYPKKLGARRAASYTGQIVRAQEEIGTGGAGFRYMYAAFIQEVAKYTGRDEFKKLSIELTEIGDLWREFAVITGRIVKNRNTIDESYDKAADLLLNIADREEEFFKKLRKLNAGI